MTAVQWGFQTVAQKAYRLVEMTACWWAAMLAALSVGWTVVRWDFRSVAPKAARWAAHWEQRLGMRRADPLVLQKAQH